MKRDTAATRLHRRSFDEVATLVAKAAMARGYPEAPASVAGEMTLWCERHRLQGLLAMADHLERLTQFDPEAAKPKPQKDGPVQFRDPVIGGMFIHHHYDDFQWPALIEGPQSGTIIFAAFLALGAHQRGDRLSIAFLGTDDRPAEGARLLYGEGRSLFEGDPSLARLTRRMGVEKIEDGQPMPPLDEPLQESVPCREDAWRRLEALISVH